MLPQCKAASSPWSLALDTLTTSNTREPIDNTLKTMPPDTGVSFYSIEHFARVLTYWNTSRYVCEARISPGHLYGSSTYPVLSDTGLKQSVSKSYHRLRKFSTTDVPQFSYLYTEQSLLAHKFLTRVKLDSTCDVLCPVHNKPPQNPTSQTGNQSSENLSDLLKDIWLLSHETRMKIPVS